MQDSTLCPRQYLHALLLCRGALCRVSHQPGKHPPYTQVLGCDSEGGRATRMAPDMMRSLSRTEQDYLCFLMRRPVLLFYEKSERF